MPDTLPMNKRTNAKRTAGTLSLAGVLWEICVCVLDNLGRVQTVREIAPFVPPLMFSYKWPLLPMFVGISILLWLRSGDHTPVADSAADAAAPVSSANSISNTQTANPTINSSPTTNIYLNDEIFKVTAPERYARETPKHNVLFAGLKEIYVNCESSPLVEERASTGAKALIARFRNKAIAGVAVATFSSVKVHTVFRDSSEIEIADLFPSPWIGSEKESIEIEAECTERIALAIHAGGTWVAPWIERAVYWDMARSEGTINYLPLPEGILSAEITLVDHNGLSLRPVTVHLRLSNDGNYEILLPKA